MHFRTEMKTIFCVVFLWILVMLFCSPAFMAHGLTIKVADNVISFVSKLGSSQVNRTSGNCAYLDGQTIPLINVGKWNRVTYQVRKLTDKFCCKMSDNYMKHSICSFSLLFRSVSSSLAISSPLYSSSFFTLS